MDILSFGAGVLAGANIGVLVASLLMAAGEQDGRDRNTDRCTEADDAADAAQGEIVYLPDLRGDTRRAGAGQQLLDQSRG